MNLDLLALVLQFAGGALLSGAFAKALWRPKNYVEHYQEFWQRYLAERPDFEEDVLRYEMGFVNVDMKSDFAKTIGEKQFERAKLRTLDWLVYTRLHEEARFTLLGLLGAFCLVAGFALQIYMLLRVSTSAPVAMTLGGVTLDTGGSVWMMIAEGAGAIALLRATPWAVDDPTTYARHQDREAWLEYMTEEPSPLGGETYATLYDFEQMRKMYEPESESLTDVEREIDAAEMRILRRLDAIADSERANSRRGRFGFLAIAFGFLLQLGAFEL